MPADGMNAASEARIGTSDVADLPQTRGPHQPTRAPHLV